MSARGGGALFLDTILNDASWAAALGAAGAVLAAVDHAHAGRGNAFAAVRPPGHHALAGKGDGLLPAEQRGHRGAARAAGGPGAGADRGLGRPPRERHPGPDGAGPERCATSRCTSTPGIRGRGWRRSAAWATCSTCPGGRAVRRRCTWRTSGARSSPPPRDGSRIWSWCRPGSTRWLGDPLGGFTLEPGHYAISPFGSATACPACRSSGLLEGGYVPARLAEGVLAHVARAGRMTRASHSARIEDP